MAGHSKWANIKHRKASQDAKKAKVYTRMIRELTIASRMGGANADDNPRLRVAIDSALDVNMAKDKIERAIKRGAGENNNENLEEVTYEGYGPGGIAFMVEAMTDNKNRTVAEVRHAFTKAGGSLGTSGSVSYMFKTKGIILFSEVELTKQDEIMEIALELEIEDLVINDDRSIVIETNVEHFFEVKDKLAKFKITTSEITKVADNYIDLDKEKQESVIKFFDCLENLEDIQNVYMNANINDIE